jgi:hypothetical protein
MLLVVVVFIGPVLGYEVALFGWSSLTWAGSISLAILALSLLQTATDWRGRAEAHRRSQAAYAEIRREAEYLAAASSVDEIAFSNLLAGLKLASIIKVEIPANELLEQKRRHEVNQAIARVLDSQPAASVLLTRFRFWLRDNRGPPKEAPRVGN